LYNSSTCTTFILFMLSCDFFWMIQNLKFKQLQPETTIWKSIWFQLKSHEYKSCTTHQDVQLLFWLSFHVMNFEWFKIWILENDNFKPDFQPLNDFSWKTHKNQICRTHQDVQLIFWSSFHLIKFEPFKFWISINVNFK